MNLATTGVVALCCLIGACAAVSKRPNRGGNDYVPAGAERVRKEVRPPRGLSDHQRTLLVSELRTGPVGKVEIVFERGNDEAANFANQITTALLLAGQLAEFHSVPVLTHHAGGSTSLRMQLPGGPVPGHAEVILNAFNVAHIPWDSAIATGGPPGILIITVQSR